MPAPADADLALGAWLAPAVVALLMPQLALVMTHERNVAQLRASHRKLRHMVEVDPLAEAAQTAAISTSSPPRRSSRSRS